MIKKEQDYNKLCLCKRERERESRIIISCRYVSERKQDYDIIMDCIFFLISASASLVVSVQTRIRFS